MKLVLNFLVTLVLFVGCRPKEITKQEITSLRDGNHESLVSYGNLILPKILGPELKRFESEVDKDQKSEVNITYGSNSALTFNDNSDYRKTGTEYQSLVMLRVGYALALHHFHRLSLSLSKPFFIQGENNPDAEIQEAEIFRTTISKSELDSFWENHPNFDPYIAPKIGDKEWEKITGEIQKLWKVELDEFSRVKLE
ncbi:hypothetical protein [Leptospira kanakyensis]|uniref:Uncharacterized protein n=1 Tax=Leptospira kanakyensis TaxID=2484968 RepID=A0A6N4Q9X9_9LEPT|nr:hypothetical protein [Leptospira kanakyensis]MCW7479873.1 hypothetical protein [Leptospira kanakyensis]TGK50103.1 hypothetical protein EHQ11_10310 [Leptospira kanakyensis]TGK64295.1 hypothetical protein EHQ16_07705 [Leptospira kanakyensis]TGK69241.1 hypothetical protein EHQ18_10470 [Leptospira kanakyensis]